MAPVEETAVLLAARGFGRAADDGSAGGGRKEASCRASCFFEYGVGGLKWKGRGKAPQPEKVCKIMVLYLCEF